MQIPWKWEGSRAPRRNPDPVGPGPTKSEIGKPLKTSCETNAFSGELLSLRTRLARHRGVILRQEALSGLHFVGFVGLGPRTSMNRFYLTAFADRFLVVSKESIMTTQGGFGRMPGTVPPRLVFSQQ